MKGNDNPFGYHQTLIDLILGLEAFKQGLDLSSYQAETPVQNTDHDLEGSTAY
jgi:hypothetical protein